MANLKITIKAPEWRIDHGDYGQGYTMRVCRHNADCQADVWGHYEPHEEHIAQMALQRAQSGKRR